MLQINGLKLKVGYTEQDLLHECAKKMRARDGEIVAVEKLKEAIDARDKNNIVYVLNVAVEVKNTYKNFKHFENISVDHTGLSYEKIACATRPVVVGLGPSGMFCALALALMGLKPIVLEQGKKVDERKADVEKFWQTGVLDENSNVQFGEGGAGTFSDGKLNSNVTNNICKKVINEFVLAGAPKEIFYKSKPHIGSDNLVKVVKNIRNRIESLGGQVLFCHQFVDFETKNNKVCKVVAKDLKNDKLVEIDTDILALGVGHSALKTFELLYNKGVNLQPKPFAMGVRIEHKQKDINLAQYGAFWEKLPPADYKLVAHLDSGRSVFTFCMCPGGVVVASSAEKETVVTNGMSNFARNEENANSALLVNVAPADFYKNSPLDGLYFQRFWENKAFVLGGGNYCAPSQTVGEFLEFNQNNNPATANENATLSNKNIACENDAHNYENIIHNCGNIASKKVASESKTPTSENMARDNQSAECENEKVTATYTPSVKSANLCECLPPFVVESLKQALPELNKKIKGFANKDAVLTAIESRSSCPVQITRDATGQASVQGLYPIGEGAGYAGGIITSAQDGVKCAQQIANNVKK